MSELVRLSDCRDKNITLHSNGGRGLQVGEVHGRVQVIGQLTVVLRPCDCMDCDCSAAESATSAWRFVAAISGLALAPCTFFMLASLSQAQSPSIAAPVLGAAAGLLAGACFLAGSLKANAPKFKD